MEISCVELNGIANTLPIGYYAKRRIKVSVDETAETSYYTPLEDSVVVSYPQIKTSLAKVKADDEAMRETAIRSNLYHEISHAILTPMKMRVTDIINIFEDERIETLLRGYYMNVDFKKMCVLMNDYHGEAPRNAMEAFYYCVRFRNYKPEFVVRVDDIIRKYAHLNRFTDVYNDRSWSWGTPSVWDYINEIEKLYNDIAKDFASTGGKGGASGMSGFSTDINISSASGGGDDGEISESEANVASGEMTDFPMSDFDFDIDGMDIDVGEIVGNAFNGFNDTNLESALKIILENFRKKNSKGSAINGYSGVINPRACGREDYKFFERASTARGNNTFGTLHLNLFIDKSGSFCYNEMIVNTLIKALTDIERTNHNFTLDLVFCGVGEKLITDKTDRFIKCSGGNYLDDEAFDIFRKLQKPQTYNYNIVLFDGDAFTDAPRSKRAECGKNFSAFDTNNTTIISDRSNERYIEKCVKKARVIYTNDYADELIKNVQQTLEKAFR